MKAIERLATVPLKAIGLDADALDGAFLHLPSTTWGLLVSLRGKDGGSLPTPFELLLARDVPPAARTVGLHVFVRRPDGALHLGTARRSKKGSFVFDEP